MNAYSICLVQQTVFLPHYISSAFFNEYLSFELLLKFSILWTTNYSDIFILWTFPPISNGLSKQWQTFWQIHFWHTAKRKKFVCVFEPIHRVSLPLYSQSCCLFIASCCCSLFRALPPPESPEIHHLRSWRCFGSFWGKRSNEVGGWGKVNVDWASEWELGGRPNNMAHPRHGSNIYLSHFFRCSLGEKRW